MERQWAGGSLTGGQIMPRPLSSSTIPASYLASLSLNSLLVIVEGTMAFSEGCCQSEVN